MICPRCGFDLTGVTAAYCPRCGQPLLPPPPADQDYSGFSSQPTSQSGHPTGYGVPGSPSSPLYGQPTGAYGPPTAPGFGTHPDSGHGYPPASGPTSPSTPYAPYGGQYGPYGPYAAGAPPSAPIYQPGAQQYYGQPSTPMYPSPMQPAPGSAWPGYAPPQPKRSFGRWLATGIVFVVMLCVIAGVALSKYAPPSRPSGPSNTSGGPAGMHVILRDTMLGANDGWATDSHCFFSSDGYHVKDGYLCYAPSGDFSNGSVAVTTKQAFGSIHYYYGIVFRRVSKGNYYTFGLDSNGYWAFIKAVNDKASVVGAEHSSTAIKTGIGASNTLEVRASGAHIEFFVNGTQLGTANDSTYSSGKVGVDGGGGGIETVFTDFTVAVPN